MTDVTFVEWLRCLQHPQVDLSVKVFCPSASLGSMDGRFLMDVNKE